MPITGNYFFSYQCARDEVPASANLRGVSVLFFDDYQPTCDLASMPARVVCPLNGASSIVGVCETCRRCFNGTAVADRRTVPGTDEVRHGPSARSTSRVNAGAVAKSG